ncbi:PaaI family thioesterase [Halobacillus shinanisalinarum]|uniref:PaaI family thioesterase n=1 Tax=Halobacillus shinanisalinarum TaxID=2932258 RepID=A0ABY4H5L4_9BACI|nr:PaaI family thioesterase [Halobacillus shinanisalinarum]UOQ95611.1 PaaI family thioesterase [Halobacillus shinanisalinarum]
MSLKNTLMEALGMEVIETQPDKVALKMPVDERTHQPMGFLHGGASVALAESAASIGSYLNIDPTQQQVFGIEINANHTKSVRSGYVYGTATPLHLGKNTMVWEIRIEDSDNQLISISRCTVGVVPRKP